ncbi:hypothetical protein PHMEG_00036946 [Phytophthora megakarya]|uniref:Uncharacterized protein n=1 Tax=Phytophthora megakarya TaxID=4795 RepID=A0A225UKW0_9STRA|nr:hypothetical protein PHMEG_00036946 [Phytophthora megakarya]
MIQCLSFQANRLNSLRSGRVLRIIQPRKNTAGDTLDREDIARNKAISADRVVEEKYFGRIVARVCAELMNYHVGLMPLRARDNEHYDMVLSTYQTMRESVWTQRAKAQRHYRMRQQVRSRPAPYNTRESASQAQFDSQKAFAF